MKPVSKSVTAELISAMSAVTPCHSDSAQLVFWYLGRTWAIRHRFVFEKDNVKSLLCSFAGGEDNGKFVEQTTLLMDSPLHDTLMIATMPTGHCARHDSHAG